VGKAAQPLRSPVGAPSRQGRGDERQAALLSASVSNSSRPFIARKSVLEGLQHLLELQRLDTEIAKRQEVLAALPAKRKQGDEALAAAEVRLEAAREQLQSVELGQRSAESALQDQEALLQKLEGQQFQVKDNTAYTALLSEMERAKEAISECETRILEEMEAIEAGRQGLADSEANERDTRANVERERVEFAGRQQKLETELAALEAERAQVGPQLDAKILAVYERVAARRHPALAFVSGEVCKGCRVGIPAQNYLEIIKGERLITCESCKRILLHSDMVQSLRGTPTGSETLSETPV
jgi:predicted  nucleic acid-binding Zn-ribbon protein